MKNMHKMPNGKMMKNSAMAHSESKETKMMENAESRQMHKMEEKMGKEKYMAGGGSVTPRGNGQAKSKACKLY